METDMSACYCIGPQNGQPLCPCQMRHVKVKNGRYVQEIDYGPVVSDFQGRAEALKQLLVVKDD